MSRLKNDPFAQVQGDPLHPVLLALDPDGQRRWWVLDRRRPELEPAAFPPCRQGSWYPHRRSYAGKYPFGEHGLLVMFESLLELVCLMELDHGGQIASIAAQPFCLKFPDSTEHYPDFAARLRDGETVVIDVKPAEFVERGSFAHAAVLTEHACATQGWRYRVMHGCSGWEADNLEWLCAFRRPEYAPDTEAAAAVAAFLATPQTMEDAARILESRIEFGIGYAQLCNLMFHRRVVAVEDGPLRPGTLVLSAQGDNR